MTTELDGTGRTATNLQSDFAHHIFPFVAFPYLLVARGTYRMQLWDEAARWGLMSLLASGGVGRTKHFLHAVAGRVQDKSGR